MNKSNIYKQYRFPSVIIQHAVWLYYRFNPSHRDIEDLLAERGINVTYEAIRLWCNRFGPKYATRLKRKHQDEPRKILTDKLRSYGVALRELIPNTIHDTSQYANNRAELSHRPTRVRERGMRRFISIHQAQSFLTVHAAVYNLFTRRA
jgi:putative transposase